MAFTVDIRGNASHLEKTLKSAKGSIASLGSVAQTGVAGLAGLGAAGAAGIGAFIVTSSQAAASLEDLSIQFEVLTGSAKSSADLLKAFREEEKKSSLNTEDYANAAKNLLGFGMNIQEVVPTLKMLGDVSMGNSKRFEGLAIAFAQTTAAGRLMGQEVLQFINAGFNPLSQIAKDTGKSMADLKKEMEDGKISVQMVKQAFINATSAGGLFYKAIDRGSAGTTAKINQTKAAVTQLQVEFGTGFNVGLKNALDATNTFLPQLTEKFSQSGEFIGAAITDSMAGNSDKFATLGTAAGELIVAGLQASVIAGLDNLGTLLGKVLAYSAENLSVSSVVAPEQAKKFGTVIRDFTSSGTTFREQIDSAMAKPSVTGALEKVNIEGQIIRGIKTGIDSTMSEAVKKGILEAWSRQPTGAKFTN
jgi:tape measure domain-containing protein